MDTITTLDTTLFLLINHLPHTELLNMAARGISGVGQGGVIWIIVAIILFYREEIRDHLFFIPFISVGVLSGISEFVLKWAIARPRPNAEIGALLLDSPGNYSFPSTHTLLAFAFAYVLSRVEKTAAVWFYILAVLISFSRIYLGVHYVSDIFAGALLGTGIGKFSIYIQKYWYNRLHETKRKTTSHRRI